MGPLTANLATLYREAPLLDRFEAAARDGFAAVAIPFPYDHAVAEITGRLRIHDLRLTHIAMPPPNFTGGARGFAALPGGEARFRHDFRRAVRFVEALGAGALHVLAGKAQGTVARSAFISNLRWAAAEAPALSLLIEPRAEDEAPGYFLNDLDLAAEVLDAVGAGNLGMIFDTGHAEAMAGDALTAWHAHGARAGMVQIADAPGRGQPGAGSVDFAAVFEALAQDGFSGPLVAGYRPAGATAKSLGWFRQVVKGS